MRRLCAIALFVLCLPALLSGCAPGADTPAYPGKSLPILMFHDVVEDGAGANEWTITTGQFRETLRWLDGHGYTTVLPRELAKGDPLPDKPVLLTFDDGYEHMLSLVLPILREYDAKAVVSVVGAYVEDKQPLLFLTWEKCRELEASGLVEIGSHTYDLHDQDNCLGRLPGEDEAAYQARVLTDLRTSIDGIEANLGAEALFFAYPNGSGDPWAADFLKEHFAMTVTTEYGVADLSGGLYDLPRINVSPDEPVAQALPRALTHYWIKGLLTPPGLIVAILLAAAAVVLVMVVCRLVKSRKGKNPSNRTRTGADDMDFSQFQWTREPAAFEIGGGALKITTRPHTDLWQRTYYHFRNDNAPVFQMETEEQYFSFTVRTDFSGSHHRFDQCGVVLYLDSDNWLKGSVEYENERFQHLGSVVTNEGWSDWATTEIDAGVKSMWYRLSRRADDYRIECSEDGVTFRQMRICHLHQGGGRIRFGVYACSPEDSSFTAVFDHFSLGECRWQAHDGQQPDAAG